MRRLVGSCLRLALALGAVMALSSGCSEPQGNAPTQPVKVALGIYSGRPDPVWTLTPAESGELEALISALPQRQGTPREGGLGYHGFTISFPGEAGTGWPAQPLVAFDGEIAVAGNGTREMAVDAGRSVEQLLLETGREHLDPVEMAAVESELLPYQPPSARRL